MREKREEDMYEEGIPTLLFLQHPVDHRLEVLHGLRAGDDFPLLRLRIVDDVPRRAVHASLRAAVHLILHELLELAAVDAALELRLVQADFLRVRGEVEAFLKDEIGELPESVVSAKLIGALRGYGSGLRTLVESQGEMPGDPSHLAVVIFHELPHGRMWRWQNGHSKSEYSITK